jgi:hypothetical protein
MGLQCIFSFIFVYCKVASTNTFRLEPHPGIYRLFLKRILEVYAILLEKSGFRNYQHVLIIATLQYVFFEFNIIKWLNFQIGSLIMGHSAVACSTIENDQKIGHGAGFPNNNKTESVGYPIPIFLPFHTNSSIESVPQQLSHTIRVFLRFEVQIGN